MPFAQNPTKEQRGKRISSQKNWEYCFSLNAVISHLCFDNFLDDFYNFSEAAVQAVCK